MKKIALIFALLLTTMSANAYVDSQYTSSEQFLVNIGYSKEASKVPTIVTQDPYRENFSETVYTPADIARRVYHYVVPGQGGDLDFYNHSGSFDGWSWKDY